MTSRVLVIGCGVIGATAAWRAAAAGLDVTCMDPAAGSGASRAAAGMLAAVTEADFTEQAVAHINSASAAVWPAFAAAVTGASGHDLDHVRTGSLTVAYDSDDAAELERLTRLQASWGMTVERMDTAAARRHEPLLGPRLAGASWAPDDGQVDPRRLHAALVEAGHRAGVRMLAVAAERLMGQPHRVTGVLDSAGTEHRADLIILAAATGTAALAAPWGVRAPVRPVKGQILRLDGEGLPWLAGPRVLRGIVRGRRIYIVVRTDAEIVVGATSEEVADLRPTAGGVFALLRDARALLPGLDEAPLVESLARARPATPDHLPLVGPTGVAGLTLLTGHHRHGVLQSALTATAVDDLLAGRPLDPAWTPASPSRFAEEVA